MGGGLDQFAAMQDKFKPDDLDVILGKAKAGESKYGSQVDRLQMDAGRRAAQTEEMRSSSPELLGLGERGATPSGRSYFDPTRVAERDLRIESKRQAAALSPFTSGYDLLGGGGGGGGRRGGGGDGMDMGGIGSLPTQMAQNSVMGAMNTAGQPPVFSAFGYGFARPSLRNPTHNAAKGGPRVMAR
jgi:hypothetical protein